MTVEYTISSSEAESGATIIFNDGTIVPVNSGNANYQKILVHLLSGVHDEELLKQLTTPALSVGKALTRLSERVVVDNGNIYFDGDRLDNSIARVIVKILGEGGTQDAYGSLVAFLEKLYQNPSEKSRNALYDFILRWDITILPDGDFLVYKGVTEDRLSIHSGYGIVDGVVFENSQLKNNIGSVVEIPRAMVDADNARGCSTGLHAGSYEYASSFGRGKLLTVKMNPRDVVSVPDCSIYQKIRACRYVVIGETDIKLPETTRRFTNDNNWADDRVNPILAQGSEAGNFANTVEDENVTHISFNYTNAYGESKFVENLEITEVVRQWNDVLVTGINSDGDYRSYKFSRMDSVDFNNDETETEVTTPVAEVKANHPSNTLSVDEKLNFELLKGAIDSGSKVSFDYVDSQNLNSTVTGFAPESVSVKNGGVLATGTVGSAYRSYKASRITNLSVEQDSLPATDKWAAATFAALQESD